MIGDRRETSPYDISFMDSLDWRVLCKVTLKKDDLVKFKEAIHENYFFEMFVEDLPMWGYIGDFSDEDFIIGEVSGSATYLFPHLHFLLGYNKDQIVSAKVSTDVSRNTWWFSAFIFLTIIYFWRRWSEESKSRILIVVISKLLFHIPLNGIRIRPHGRNDT